MRLSKVKTKKVSQDLLHKLEKLGEEEIDALLKILSKPGGNN